MCKSRLLTVAAAISLASAIASQAPGNAGTFPLRPTPEKAAPARIDPGPRIAAKSGARTLPASRIPRTTPRPAASTFDPARVMYDDRGDGELWAATGAYKVRFAAGAVTFVPGLGASARRNWPVTFRVTRATAGDEDLSLDDLAPMRRNGDTVDVDRGAVIDRWHLRSAEAEQTFVFSDLPRRADLEVEVSFETDLACRPDGRGFEFRGPDGGVRYGAAIAIDARGRRTELASRLEGTRIVHRVPAAFVAEAALPIVVDPVVSTFSNSAASRDFGSPDMAFDPAAGRFLLVSERRWSLSDTDVWSELREQDGQLVAGSGAWIDVSTDNWQNPQVANNAGASKFLVVAEARDAGGSYTAIRGRVRDAVGPTTVHPEITISTAPANDAVHPDVGGDGNPSGSPHWAVVWGHRHSVTDTDVLYRIVRDDGTFTTPSAIVLENSTADEIHTRISKSNGRADPASQSWMVVFEREISPTTHVILGAELAPDGSIVHPTFLVRGPSGGSDFIEPDVSSPTEPILGRRYHLVVSQFRYSATDHDIWADLIDNGQPVASLNLTGAFLDLQVTPAVDSDGCRFAVTYSHGHNPALNDYDIYATTVHLVGRQNPILGTTEVHVPVGTSGTWEGRSAIAATHAPGEGRYMVAFEDDNGSASSVVNGAIYEGLGSGGLTRLPHGCHNFPITVTGEPRLGTRISFRVPGPTGGITTSGTLFGILRTPAVRLPLCSVPCYLGVDGPAFPALIHVDIPCDGSLLGVQAAVQGWDLVGGSCFGAGVRLSDTIVMTVF